MSIFTLPCAAITYPLAGGELLIHRVRHPKLFRMEREITKRINEHRGSPDSLFQIYHRSIERKMAKRKFYQRIRNRCWAAHSWWYGNDYHVGKCYQINQFISRVRRDFQPWLYVNTYDCTQEYGGAEEGGWFYDAWEPAASQRVARWRARGVAAALEEGRRPEGRWFDRLIQSPDPLDEPTTDHGMAYDRGQSIRIEVHPARGGNNYSPYC